LVSNGRYDEAKKLFDESKIFENANNKLNGKVNSMKNDEKTLAEEYMKKKNGYQNN
jgi:hypothetical protein